MVSWNGCLRIGVCVALLFFFIPIKIGVKDVETQFREYLNTFNKTYNDSVLYDKRLQAFKKSLETIKALNQNRTNDSALYGLTRFSDLHPDEFSERLLTLGLSQRTVQKITKFKRSRNPQVPGKVDWRKKQVVSPLKYQAECGACWAFSVIETIESMVAIKTGKLQDLSVQQMIDCAGNGNKGCGGGDTCNLLQWMKNSHAKVQTEKQYPLRLKNQECHLNDTIPGPQIDEFTCDSFIKSEHDILELLARNGPVVVAINAQTWQNYIGGVISYHCSGSPLEMNHAVQIVGYDLTKGGQGGFYIARNTWGADFGDGGYLYLAIGNNVCGVANEVSALTVL